MYLENQQTAPDAFPDTPLPTAGTSRHRRGRQTDEDVCEGRPDPLCFAVTLPGVEHLCYNTIAVAAATVRVAPAPGPPADALQQRSLLSKKGRAMVIKRQTWVLALLLMSAALRA